MEKVTLSSGAVLEITESGIEPQHELFRVVMEELGAVDVSALTSPNEMNINVIKDLMCRALSSKKLLEAIKPMLRRATYNGEKINDIQFFDVDERKRDFLPVLKEVARVNLAPFGESVLSMLKEMGLEFSEKKAKSRK